MQRLKDKVAIVTGGGRGIGKAICLKMAEEAAKVVVADILDKEARQTADEINANGGEALAVKVDVTNEKDTLYMANQAIEKLGSIDILVNNAGMLYGLTRESIMGIPLDEWDRVMEVNVKGILLCCKAVFPQMKSQAKGKIINMSSDVFYVGPPNFSHYATSKGAVIALTRCLAAEAAPYNICVNSVAPGVVDTESTASLPELREMIISQTPLRRLAQPEDIAGAVLFFASGESNHVTGQTLIVDGGMIMQ